MAKMLGKAAIMNRQSRCLRNHCPEHAGIWKEYVRYHKGAQRAREKQAWRREMIL